MERHLARSRVPLVDDRARDRADLVPGAGPAGGRRRIRHDGADPAHRPRGARDRAPRDRAVRPFAASRPARRGDPGGGAFRRIALTFGQRQPTIYGRGKPMKRATLLAAIAALTAGASALDANSQAKIK